MVPAQPETPESDTIPRNVDRPSGDDGATGSSSSRASSKHRRQIRWIYVLVALAIVYGLLHIWIWDGPKGSEGEDLRSVRRAVGFGGVRQTDGPYEVSRFLYSLVAHMMIVIATWHFSRGWHGLLALLLVSLTCYSSQGFAMGAHNMLTALGIHRLDLLVWFYGVLLEYSLCFFLALLLKPFATKWTSRSPRPVSFELSDAMWLTFAAAMVALAWSRVPPPGGNLWPTFRCVSVSLLAAAIVLVLTSSQRIPGIVLLLLAIGLHVLATQQMKTPEYDLLPGGMLSNRGGNMHSDDRFINGSFGNAQHFFKGESSPCSSRHLATPAASRPLRSSSKSWRLVC